MDKYGSDKPDLRIDLTVTDATEALGACGFGPFEGNLIKAVPVSGCKLTRKAIDKLCADVEVQAGQKPYWFRVDDKGEIVGGIAKFLNAGPDLAAQVKEAPLPGKRHPGAAVRRDPLSGVEDLRRHGEAGRRPVRRPPGQGAVRVLLDCGLPHV